MALKTQVSSVAVGVVMTAADLLDEIWPKKVYLRAWEIK
jgi:hypothetical protein